MTVMMQAFFWDCPREAQQEYQWWNHVRGHVAALAEAGFGALWLPPVHKAANLGGPSMGYDPYDYYDLGEFDQKGSVKTWFGSKDELLALIAAAHANGMDVIADFVVNHCSGADAQELNPITGEQRWTRFEPASGKFRRDWECFLPNPYESWEEGSFGEMPDLSHRNPHVFGEILKLARWLVEEIGFDGFRYDYVKGYGANTVTAVQEYRYQRAGKVVKPYGVAEYWDNARAIERWIDITGFSNQNPVRAFDFPLRETLKLICDQYGFGLRNLIHQPSLAKDVNRSAVTFVENHDLRDQGRGIVNDKMLAYGYILTHEGSPCVFWKDYFVEGLGQPGSPNGIAALVAAHESHAGGGTEVLWVDDDVYIMQRLGAGNQPGLIFVWNNRGDDWRGAWVRTRWRDREFTPVAWWSGSDVHRPDDQRSGPEGHAPFWAAPRGFTVYVPRP
jgi:alpha-amylase